MTQSTLSAALLAISLDRKLKEPLHAQLANQFRKLILERQVATGQRLPSSRLLARELSVSRATVTSAFDQLISEGYAEGRPGSGVYAATDLPEYAFSTKRRDTTHGDDLPLPKKPRPFETSAPDLDNFPYREWARLLDQAWRAPEAALLAKPDPFGWGPLRGAITAHLHDWRGVTCSPSQIIITSGLVDAIELIAKAALNTGDIVMVEEPGHHILRSALLANALKLRPVPVDNSGFATEQCSKTIRKAGAVVVTPSRHFPLGMTLPLARRLELLEWANREGGLIIEDDFDSEYRYVGQPLPALMSLDEQECVIYVGSFSKVMMPALRLGFVVLPNRLIKEARKVLASTGPRASLVAQPALQRFMESGSFSTHIRRMRRLYIQRQKILTTALSSHTDGLISVEPSPGGMHIVADFTARFAEHTTDIEVSQSASLAGLTLSALSTYYAGKPTRQGLLLGFAGFDEASLHSGVARLIDVLASYR
ncbi:MAG: PLP-dependent aminotransferase family protein [Hyphomicrobiaceae bacterium]